MESKFTRNVPIVAIRGAIVFPHTDTLLSFGRPKSVSAINIAFREDKIIAIFTQKDSKTTDPHREDLYEVGTIATVTQMMSTEGELHALVRGQARVKLDEIIVEEPYLLGKVTEIPESVDRSSQTVALARNLSELFKKSINLGKQAEVMTVMRLISNEVAPIELVDQIASLLEIKIPEKQKLLEIANLKERLAKVLEFLGKEVGILELERSISVKTQKRFETQMRKAMLREKKRTIEEELGEAEGEGELEADEFSEYKKKIKLANMPKEVKIRAEKELKRLSQLSPQNPEGGYLRNYLDWLVEMPWNVTSPNNVSIKRAARILEEGHYALEKAKERILEFLAVMKIKGEGAKSTKSHDSQPTILCFIGPPGVGKTSIGRSIAEALNRKFIRVSLGGIRDEAEIRGHRRTYVGALPGRIIQGIKNAGTKNPVFMLDEVDKVGADFRGDPSFALLEALDPEQNNAFSDHYLEVPFDLSEVMFITTGNITDTIPPALKDRMEIIRFPGYTEDEKYHIAQKFIWPKQVRLHGLSAIKIVLAEASLREIINRYTREAGVRDLERNLASICRKLARFVAEKKKYPTKIGTTHVHKFLGPQKFTSLVKERKDEVGMATGLAVTAAGGEILFIEVALMPGRGKLLLTGQLGEIMQESAKAAFTYAKAHYQDLGLRGNFAEKIDVHIHVPEGAVPKDGPSAGIAITAALVSALTGIPVVRNVGMTGEVTLRGRVLEIGGVKEKVIAAHRAGLSTIILPADNKKDLEDVPENVRRDIKFVFAGTMNEVLEVAVKFWPPKSLFAKKPRTFVPIPLTLTAN